MARTESKAIMGYLPIELNGAHAEQCIIARFGPKQAVCCDVDRLIASNNAKSATFSTLYGHQILDAVWKMRYIDRKTLFH